MPVLIVAFDGILVDSLPLRAQALAEACAAEQAPRPLDAIAASVPGRTMFEAALQLCSAAGERDPTLPELVALRAQRAYRQLVQHGIPLHPEVLGELRAAAARGTRLVLRADSERRDVDPLLAMVGLDPLFALVRCSDDAPRGQEPSLARSWRAIDDRLRNMRQDVTMRTAWETDRDTARVAQPFVSAVQFGPAPRSD